jgi:regulator of protease activity HflC (stomatin/prohibitin superfamily)
MPEELEININWTKVLKWTAGLFLFIVFLMFTLPTYKVYQQKMVGKAAFEKATQDRKIVTQEALAKKEAAADLAAADTIRARGIAASNAIIGQSLHENPEYLKWLWISELEKTRNQVIYVPTEANLPILESQRLNHLSLEKE